MEIAENEENSTTNPVTPPLPITVELCSLCTQYLIHISAGKGFKKRVSSTILKTYLSNQKRLNIFFVSYFLRQKNKTLFSCL